MATKGIEKGDGIIEEDWSQLLTQGNNEDGFNARFSYYDKVSIPLSTGSRAIVMELCCVRSLTPLDMMDLSNGYSDATGNRLWMGAVLFIECMVRPLPSIESSKTGKSSNNTDKKGSDDYSKVEALSQLRRILFGNKNVVELGAGTGASLVSVGMASIIDQRVRPYQITLTDNDENVLSLCEVNCASNLNEIVKYNVCRLDWGLEKMHLAPQNLKDMDKPNDLFGTDDSLYKGGSHDTVVATDVIYDLSAVKILFETASHLLKNGGLFVLSHVPRASIECEPSATREALEGYLIEEASRHFLISISKQFEFGASEKCVPDRTSRIFNLLLSPDDCAIRPNDLMGIWGEGTNTMSSTKYSYKGMDSVGASVMIFVKRFR